MKKIISFVGMFAVMGVAFGDAHGVAMSANIRRLLQEKQDKIAKLEECEGKKQGWMIAGISTIGLTAVGVGVNIAQASKSNRLSDEIEMEKTTLQRQQDELDRIQNDIATKQAEKAEEERKRAEEEERGRNNAARANAGNSSVNVEVNPIPVLDNPDGKIGDTCGENSEGKWTEMTNGTKKCSNENVLVNCECIKNVQADVEPVSPVKPEKDCRASHGKKPTTNCPCDGDKGLKLGTDGTCQCEKTGETWNGSNCVKEKKDTIAERVLGQPCWKSDLPTGATDGIYWKKPGDYQCRYNSELVKCSCQVTKCKGDLVADENHEKCVKKNVVTDCSEGYVRIGGKGDCVKSDYLFTDQCECAKDPSKMCKLDTDHGGDFVCQLAKGIGKKCKCEDCPKGESWNGQKCVGKKDEKKDDKKPAGQCIKTYEEYLGVGCVCDSGKGLIPVLDDMSGKRYCGCGMSDTWNGTKCVSSNTAFKPKGNYTVSYGGEKWNGIGACSSVPGGNAGNVVNEQSKVQRAYDNYKVTDDNGENCYCKIIDPKKSSWVFSYRFGNLAECVKSCVVRCQGHISSDYPEFQKNVFDTIM